MTSQSLTSLAARAEAGSGADLNLNQSVAIALGWHETTVSDPITGDEVAWREPDGRLCHHLPRWTSSLDAVVTLLAERLAGEWKVDWIQHLKGEDYWTAAVRNDGAPLERGFPKKLTGVGSSAARALLSAALRAIAQSLGQGLRALAAQQQDRSTEGE